MVSVLTKLCSRHHFMTWVRITTPVRPTPALQWTTIGDFFPLPSSLSASLCTESTSSRNPTKPTDLYIGMYQKMSFNKQMFHFKVGCYKYSNSYAVFQRNLFLCGQYICSNQKSFDIYVQVPFLSYRYTKTSTVHLHIILMVFTQESIHILWTSVVRPVRILEMPHLFLLLGRQVYN